MSDFSGPTTYWQDLGLAADRGELFLRSDAAASCYAACEEYIAKLRDHQAKAGQLGTVSCWGEFESGKQLQRIYADRAVGGEGSLVDVLQSHIDVVSEMQAVFRKFFVATEATDVGNATDIGVHGPR